MHLVIYPRQTGQTGNNLTTIHQTRGRRTRNWVQSAGIGLALITVAACARPLPPVPAEPPFFLAEVPPEVVAMAAPYQNLQLVRLKPEDGCYWYQHAGPVETTLLPLRTSEGRPICLQREGTPQITG